VGVFRIVKEHGVLLVLSLTRWTRPQLQSLFHSMESLWESLKIITASCKQEEVIILSPLFSAHYANAET